MKSFNIFYAIFISSLFLSILTLFQLMWVLELNIAPMVLPIALPIASLITYTLNQQNPRTLKNVLITFCIFIIAGLIAYFSFDKAGDGRWYHQPIILLFKHGWNPIYDYKNFNLNSIEIVTYSYPHANEVLSYAFVSVFGHIQIGKIVNILFAIYGFSIAMLVLQDVFKLSYKQACLVAVYIAFNPFFTAQYLSYYVDANFVICFTILLFSLLLWFYNSCYAQDKHIRNFTLLNIFCTIMISANMKTSGVAYAVIIVGGVLITKILYEYYYQKTRLNKILTINLYFILILIGFEIFMGWHPYMENIINGHHVFWPLVGDNKQLNIVGPSGMPFVWSPYNKLVTYLLSYFLPYPISYPEISFMPNLKGYVAADYDFGSLGPFWWLFLLLGIYFCMRYVPKLYVNIKHNNFIALAILLSLIIIVLSIMVNPYSIYMRYIPQIILIPAFAMIILFKYNASFLTITKQRIFILMVVVNSGLFLCGSTAITGYRAYRLKQMEHACKLSSECVLDLVPDNMFADTLINQLIEDKVKFSYGSCANRSIIWQDAKANGKRTNVMCY